MNDETVLRMVCEGAGCGWVERRQIPWELKGVARI